MNETSRRELITRVTASESLCRITRIHAVLHEPHILWSLCKEFPRYRRQVQMAVRLIGMLFSGKWFSLCTKCGERTDALAEHILLYCPSSNAFRFVLWQKLFSHFSVEFYGRFISLAPCDQVNALFSGFYEQERDETVRLDSLKILLQSLRLIGCYLSMDKLMLS